ncbi:hypothetical protein LJR164_003206 [Phenylobacterium sp. LjRoot164]|uniref:hypothetical protein n=1 Tax=unclassified Phenylobacterium TaxID=2640670 RepID=UPI003ECDC4FB
MKKLLTATLAAVTAAGAIAASAGSAQAEPYRYHRGHDNNDAAAAAIVGGVLGLALGAAIVGSNNKNRGYYDNSYYSNGYYNNGGYYGDSSRYYDNGYYGGGYARPYAYAPRTCVSRDRVYDPYIGRRVTIERRYAC